MTLKNTESSSVEISWSAPAIGGDAQNVTEYFVTWDPPNSEGMTNHTTADESITIELLQSNTKYVINVAARSKVNGKNGEFSDNLEAITCRSIIEKSTVCIFN